MNKISIGLIGVLYLFTNTLKAQIITISGKIVDATKQTTIPYANIGIPKYAIGTSANANGEFILKINESHINDTLVCSSVGYNSFKILIKNIENRKDFTVKLTLNEIKLDEFLMKSKDGRKIVQNILARRYENYGDKPALMQVFCREVIKQKDAEQYFAYSEGILEMYKASVKKNDDHIRLIKGRKKKLNNAFKAQDKILPLPVIVNGPTAPIILDIVKDPKSFLLKHSQFNFFHDSYAQIDEHMTYVVHFEPKDTTIRVLLDTDADFVKGKIYVDTTTFALIRAEYELSPRGKRALNIPFENYEVPIRIINRKYIINYEESDNKWYFKSANINNHFAYRNDLIDLSHTVECVVTQTNTGNVKKFAGFKDIRENQSLGDNITKFDDSFWEDYNFIKSNISEIAQNDENTNTPSVEINPDDIKVAIEKPTKANAELSSKHEVNFFKGSFEDALKLAAEQQKLIFIDIYTDWCQPCKVMAAEAFKNQDIAEILNGFFINYRADAEKSGKYLAKKYNVKTYPTTLIVDSKGKLVKSTIGYGGLFLFKKQLEFPLLNVPDGDKYLFAEAEFNSNRNIDFLISYAQLRKKIGFTDDKITDKIIAEIKTDTITQSKLQFISSYASDLESETFRFIAKNKKIPIFNIKINKLISEKLKEAAEKDDKTLLRKILKANALVVDNLSVLEENNQELSLIFYEKSNDKKAYHETALELLEKHYLPAMLKFKSENNMVLLANYVNKIKDIAQHYTHEIKEKNNLKEFSEQVQKAYDMYNCHELACAYGCLLYRLKDVTTAKTLLTKAIEMSNNYQLYVDILNKMNDNTF